MHWFLVQFEYDNWLAEKSNSPPIEEWREGMYFVTGRRKRSSPETYRDQWEDEDLMSMAYQEFRLSNPSPLFENFHLYTTEHSLLLWQ